MADSVRVVRRRVASVVFLCLCAATPAVAQQAPRPAADSAANQDPPPPIPPEVVSRGANGRTVVRATRIDTPLRIDGNLDEPIYGTLKSITDFIQAVPNEGKPATEKTEAWVMFDDNFIYISGRCWDTAPPEKWTANELRRDTSQLRQNDMFGVLLDTFHDRRNGYNFYTNPLGGFADQIITDEGNPNVDWNPVWQVRTGRFEGGWTAELAIPFKSIRYVSGKNQTWGIQLRRSIRRKNEWTHLTALPPQGGGSNSVFRISRAATLIGLDLPPAGKNVELKPYGINRVTTDKQRSINNDVEPAVGIDAKYGVTANLTADITVNTDFAQVEVDEQQVNLTRFQLQFPEKRDFFLEGRGIFDFGRTSSGPGNGNATPTTGSPSLFYSRRIGLNNNAVIPIDVGGRLTGKTGKYSIGLLNLQTGDDEASNTPTTNFTVMRLKRDILRRSSVGMMVTNRSKSVVPGADNNLAFGVDSLFSLYQDLNLGGFWARSVTDGRDTDRDSYSARFDYAADRYGAKVEYLKVGSNFQPEVGFVRRRDFGRTFGTLRFSPRPKGRNRVRRYSYEGTFENLENGSGQLESREQGGKFSAEFQNSDVFTVQAGRTYELLVNPFTVSGVTIPKGGYTYTDQTTSYQFGQQRRVSGTASLQVGQFYNGNIKAASFSSGRVAILKQWSAEPSVSVNRVTLPTGDFTQTVVRTRTDYGFSPRMFISGLVQWSATDHLRSHNVRFRWEYLPGSELFVVYTDERDSRQPYFDGDLRNKAFVVKVNRLLRF